MRSGGAKPKPLVTHKLEGTARAHIRRKKEPEAKGELKRLTPPRHLTESQKEVWLYALENAPIGVLKHIDKDVMLVWVIAVDTHAKATEALNEANEEEGSTPFMITGERGSVMNPLVRVVNQAALIILRASEHLGFSPVARPRLAKEIGDDELLTPTRKGENDILNEPGVTSITALIKNRPR